MPSKVDDGGEAVLVFRYKTQARARAAKHYGFDTYADAEKLDWCEVKRFPPLTTKTRKRIVREATQARKARGELPGFMKNKKAKKS